MRLFLLLLRELKNHRNFSLLFVLNLSMGLAGFIALDGFKNSLDQTLRARSKSILGADFGLSARRPITQAERKLVASEGPTEQVEAQTIELFSMVASQAGRSRLIQIKAIEGNYPFYGEIELENRDPGKGHELKGKPIAWAYPEILTQLGIKVGDIVKLGEAEFTVQESVFRDSAAGMGTTMAPRIYVHLDQLERTGLVRPGSVAWYSYVYYFPQPPPVVDDLRKTIFEKIDNPDVQVYTHENVSQQVGRLLNYLNDFLGLSSLAALFLASVGAGFLFRSYFRKKIKEIAILICLGTSPARAFSMYLFQVLVLGAISALIAFGFSFLLVPSLSFLTAELLPFRVDLKLSASTLGVGMLLGTVGSFLVCLPILVQLKDVRPNMLLSESSSEKSEPWSATTILAMVPGIVAFWLVSVFLSNSLRTGSLFSGMFFGSGILMAIGATLFFRAFAQLKMKSRAFGWAVRDLSRNQITTLSCFLSIGLGMLLLNLIPQLQASIDTELQSPEKSKIPSLFLFDIQEEQLDQFLEIAKDTGARLNQVSPMIRARLLLVNGEPFDKGTGSGGARTRDEEREMRNRNRGYNLSYRSEVIDSEEIIEGRPFSGKFDLDSGELPEISLEKRFANRLDLEVGDTLTFDIQSVELKGKVVSIRSIQWTSFEPNFFIQFQPGVLETAPKTYLATLAGMNRDEKIDVQNKIVDVLPNISIIDVTRLVERLQGIMSQMSLALEMMAFLCLAAGFVVIYSIANYQANRRRWDIGLLKALGASFKDIRNQFLWQFLVISLVASLGGVAISLGISLALSTLMFDSAWALDLTVPAASLAGCVAMTVLVSHLATRKALSIETQLLFSARD